MSRLWRNSQLLTTFSTSTSKYFTAVCTSHALPETVLVSSLSFWRLKCSFHGNGFTAKWSLTTCSIQFPAANIRRVLAKPNVLKFFFDLFLLLLWDAFKTRLLGTYFSSNPYCFNCTKTLIERETRPYWMFSKTLLHELLNQYANLPELHLCSIKISNSFSHF